MKILHLDFNHPRLIDGLKELGLHNDEDYNSSKPELLQKIGSYDGLVLRSRIAIDKTIIDAASRLKFIARVGAGMENIDCSYASLRGITLISAPEGNANALGEHALAMLLNLMNNVCKAHAEVRRGLWLRAENRGTELSGKVVGIVGYGNMGKSFAKKLSGFDVEVICYDIKESVGDRYAKQVSMEEFWKASDIVSLHIPETPDTIGLVNQNYINRFKKNIWLINTARGKNVVTYDLVEALESKKIRGAALDVLEYEKSSFESLRDGQAELPDTLKYLLFSDNVIITPHIGGWSHESNLKMAEVIVSKVKAFCLSCKIS